ncbi:DUF2637 domain-containing protein [Prescottella equi]|uniref:DUF2637 domain-containing protein n=1 Tax=Rhodococcus hoagii TaxID=43767 RepID=UPI00198160A1|nr:DUF2637 domain-containing protein [Prescottella equi]
MTRHLPAAATYAIAVLAFALSYSNLAALAGRAGYGPVMAHVWPLVVDGLAVVATAAVMRLPASRVYAWSLLAAATAVSIVAGAAAHLLPAGPLPGWAGAAVAVVPPLCLLVAPHLAVQLRRDAVGATAADAARDIDAVDAPNDGAAPIDSRDADASTLTLVIAPEPARSLDSADQERRAATPNDAADAALFDVDAPPESREEKLSLARNLLATTRMSQREIARRVGLSKDAVNRLTGPGGRDALRAAWQADATRALAAVGG